MDQQRLIHIGLLEGKANWSTWKYKVNICLRGIPGAMDAVEGKLTIPAEPAEQATAQEKTTYKRELDTYLKAESNALLVLTTNMTEETLKKVMRFNTSKEVWTELHKLFDGVSEDKVYHLCMQFFGFKRNNGDDIATHISKLKTFWNELKQEMHKESEENPELPDLFLICKILGTLSEDYFSFKSSWMLMSKNDRTVDNLTNQLCAYEKALQNRGEAPESQEALTTDNLKKKPDQPKKKKIICNYCKKPNHTIKKCRQWIADGKPPKPAKSETPGNTGTPPTNSMNMVLQAITSFVCAAQCDNESWYVDNGATSHITNCYNFFKSFEKFSTVHTVTAANGETTEAVGKGTVEVEVEVSGKRSQLSLEDVWYVPKIQKNLLSVLAAHDKNTNSTFISTPTICNFKIGEEVALVGTRARYGGLFKLKMRSIKQAEVNAVSQGDLLQLYHERFGHQNKRHVKALIHKHLDVNVKLDSEVCEGCIYGKAHRLPFGTRNRASRPGELIHSDVCGPFEKSMGGHLYFVLFKDDYTRFRVIYPIAKKSDVHKKLSQFIAEIKTIGHTFKVLLSDGGKEFDNGQVREILEKEGIIQRLTVPYTPEQNGCSERDNRTVVETARAIMHAHGNIPQSLWAEIISTAAYILNRTGPSSVTGVSPFELWYGTKPGLKHLRVIGSTCYPHIPKQGRKKMDRKAVKGILIGYDQDDGYRIWCGEAHKLIRSRDVIFDEKVLQGSTDSIPVCEDPEDAEDSSPTNEAEEESESDVGEAQKESESDEDEHFRLTESTEEERTTRKLRDRSKIKAPSRFRHSSLMVNTSSEPEFYREAISSDQQDKWKEAMDQEMKAHAENQTWVLADLPHGKKPISRRWVYKIKTNADGSIDKYKARLVIKGFSQKKGIDYNQTFSPVARTATIRTLLSVAAKKRMKIAQIDVSTAFLYGELREQIFMKQPEGYDDGSGKVCQLIKSLYGLKQAPRCFFSYIIELGFQKSEADPCLFIRQKGSTRIFFALYVDDGIIAADDERELEDFINELRKKFKITSKPATYYLGLEIDRKEDGEIQVSQKHYVERILDRFGMSDCRAVTTPIIKDTEAEQSPPNVDFPYRSAVGALMYLMCGTRPDIAYAVGVASRNLEKPTERDVTRVKRIFRYLKGTADFKLIYKGNSKEDLQCYSDADHGGDPNAGRSTSGVLCLYSGAPISWLSQRQASVAISTTEAEIVAASEAAREIIWVKRLLVEFGQLKNITPVLQDDNEAAIRLAQNPEYHRRTKHIRLRHFFVREQVTAGEIAVSKVDTENQLADILTKPLFSVRLRKLCCDMGIC